RLLSGVCAPGAQASGCLSTLRWASTARRRSPRSIGGSRRSNRPCVRNSRTPKSRFRRRLYETTTAQRVPVAGVGRIGVGRSGDGPIGDGPCAGGGTGAGLNEVGGNGDGMKVGGFSLATRVIFGSMPSMRLIEP